MKYEVMTNQDNLRVKILAFVIIMPAFLDVINVLLKTFGFDVTSVVTASIYFSIMAFLVVKCKIQVTDIIILLGYYIIFLINFIVFDNTRDYMVSIGMLIVYFFFIPCGIFAFKNIRSWNYFFKYLYGYSKIAIISGAFMLFFLPYNNYLGYMDYSYSLLPAVCSAYYHYSKNQDVYQSRKSYISLTLFFIGTIEMAAFGARSGIFYTFLFIIFLDFLRDDISRIRKIMLIGLLSMILCITFIFLDDILYFISEIPYFENSYIIRSFLKGKLYNTDTRQVIWESCFERLNTMGLDISGFFGDRAYCGGAVYPHNIILEIVMSWGWIVGTIIILYLIYIISRSMCCKNIERDVSIFIICSCLSRFFMSGTYIREGKFWIAFFVFLALSKMKKRLKDYE